MEKVESAIISNFSIVASKKGKLGIVVTLKHSWETTQSTQWNAIAPDKLHDCILGLLKVAGVESTDDLPDSEVRITLENNVITGIGHSTEMRWWKPCKKKADKSPF
jgi:hypothetical protein